MCNIKKFELLSYDYLNTSKILNQVIRGEYLKFKITVVRTFYFFATACVVAL